MARTRSGKIYNALVAVTSKTTSHVAYTPDEILELGLATPTISLHDGLTPAMYAMWRGKHQITSIARLQYYKITLEILDAHGSVALGHVSHAKDSLLHWALGCFMISTDPEEDGLLVELIHTIIRHMKTPKEMSTVNYNDVNALFWIFYMAHVFDINNYEKKHMDLEGIIIHILNKCVKKGWFLEDINFQRSWFRWWGAPKTFHISDLTTPKINKLLIQTFF